MTTADETTIGVDQYGEWRNDQAERAVLGAIMLGPDVLADVQDIIDPSDFWHPAHETVYTALCGLYAAGQPVDLVTVANQLKNAPELAPVGGVLYLHDLATATPSAYNAVYYANLVRQSATRRKLAAAGRQIQQLANSDGELADMTDQAEAAVHAVTARRADEHTIDAPTALEDLFARLEAGPDSDPPSPTGISDLDSLLGGLRPGRMIVVGARPAVGKSIFGIGIARAVAASGRPAVLYSLEMSYQEIWDRIAAAEARVNHTHLRDLCPDSGDWERLAKHHGRMSGWNLIVDDSPHTSIASIRSHARRAETRYGRLGVLVVDYLQLMTSNTRPENRQVEVSAMSRGLKLLAKELHVPVVALSQLNRAAEARPDKRPSLADLRESGSLEQDADTVLLLHRPDVYDSDDRPGEVDIQVAKNRQGPISTVVVAAQGHYARFVDMARGLA